ncbi:MAG TPA: hypothetical protein VM076_14775 [Gemmatimonadaceae bacterium]|nr:hypothetical protein [Gemmatimonadaceae bacterium]
MAIQRSGVAWISLFASVAAFMTACGSPSGDAPPTAPPDRVPLVRAIGGTGPAVTAADPASARQGTVTLDVRITGSGFDSGSRASWQLNGVAYPKIVVNRTTYVSSTAVIANITVAADAAAITYDIAVVTGTGKKGIGAEMFTVTYATAVPGLTEGRAINDAGQIVGQNGSSVVIVDPVAGAVSVASNALAYDVDRNGRAIVGKDADGDAVIWTSASGASGPWAATKLPATGIGTVRSIASDAAGDAVLLSGSNISASGQRIPTVWSRTATGWQKTLLNVPAGAAGAWGEDINTRGQVAGMDGSGCCSAFYWDSLGAATVLTGLSGARNSSAWAINGDGTIIVGLSGTSAVLWRRTLTAGTYGSWSSAIVLENTTTLCGRNGSSVAYDVNSAGTVVVGQSCGIAVAWRLSGGAVTSRTVLQGLGPPNQSLAWGVNDLSSPLATGSAKTSTGVMFLGF